jgi:hypothetical protein
MTTIAAYDAIADWYDQYIQGPPFYYDRICAVTGDVAGQRVCDLAWPEIPLVLIVRCTKEGTRCGG